MTQTVGDAADDAHDDGHVRDCLILTNCCWNARLSTSVPEQTGIAPRARRKYSNRIPQGPPKPAPRLSYCFSRFRV